MINNSSVRCVQAILGQRLFLTDDPKGICKLEDINASLEIPWWGDSILPSRITLSPLLIAALFAASEDGDVQIDRLRTILNHPLLVSEKVGNSVVVV